MLWLICCVNGNLYLSSQIVISSPITMNYHWTLVWKIFYKYFLFSFFKFFTNLTFFCFFFFTFWRNLFVISKNNLKVSTPGQWSFFSDHLFDSDSSRSESEALDKIRLAEKYMTTSKNTWIKKLSIKIIHDQFE